MHQFSESFPQPKKSCLGMSILTLLLGGFTLLSLMNLDADKIDLNQARQTEGKYNIQKMNMAQKDLFVKEKIFARSLSELAMLPETDNYQYSIQVGKQGAVHFAIAKNSQIKSYVGSIAFIDAPNTPEKVKFLTIVCETNFPESISIDPPLWMENQLICGNNTTIVNSLPVANTP